MRSSPGTPFIHAVFYGVFLMHICKSLAGGILCLINLFN